MKILITAGATREPLDAVRFLSNVSTGATGASLAALLAARGHAVTLLRGEGSMGGDATIEQEIFSSALDLSTRLQHRLATGSYNAVIMSAAVSDYRAASPISGKITSDSEQLALLLVRNPKILPLLKSFSPGPLHVVGFKLTAGASPAERRGAVTKQFTDGGVDAVVFNDLSDLRAATRDAHPFMLYAGVGAAPQPLEGVASLATALDSFLTHGSKPPSASVNHTP
jgi:phosphopantothenoylcysteine synthetase/decarboxylase